MSIQSCVIGSIAEYVPTPEKPWNAKRIAHLYRRMAFGATNQQIQNGLALTPSQLVDQIIDNAIALPLPAPPVWETWTRFPIDDYANYDEEVYQHRDQWIRQWLTDMVNNGFREKIALFWSNHFVTEWWVYMCSAYMYEYHKLMQQHALGDFKAFVHAVGITPAMLVYLNNNQNKVGEINENYAREYMELFTQGEGNNYTEDDVVETARAFTGWNASNETCEMVTFNPAEHDTTDKTIFGQTGPWTYDDVVYNLSFVYRTNEIAQHICTKLYKYFIYEEIDTAIVNALATTFINNDFQIAPVLRQLFKSEHFFSDEAMGLRVKSPVETFVGLLHTTGMEYTEDMLNTIGYYCAELGQEILTPINVAGWPGYRDWINENTLTRRWDFVGNLVLNNLTDPSKQNLVDLAKILAPDASGPGGVSNDPAVISAAFVDHFLPNGLPSPTEYAAVTEVLKAGIPENYFVDGTWNLDWVEAQDQLQRLLNYLVRVPEFQLA